MEILYEDAEHCDIIHDGQRNEIIKGFWGKPFPDREENIDECDWYQILAKKKGKKF